MRQVAATEGRPDARGGRAVRPSRRPIAAVPCSTAASSRTLPGDSTANSTPPTAYPVICTSPLIMLKTERPSMNPPLATTSFTSPHRTPPPSDATSPCARTTAKTAQIGSPGAASTAVAAAKATEIPTSVALGGSRSAPDIRSVAPSICASDGPNMLTADSSGDPVAR